MKYALKYVQDNMTDVAIPSRSSAITLPSVSESNKFETQTKFMLLNLVISSLGRLARKKEYVSSLFHFLDLFPLVSSRNITRGRVNVCLPFAAIFAGCGVEW